MKRNFTFKASSELDEKPIPEKKNKQSPSKDELKDIINKQKQEIKILKQKVRRREKKIDSLSSVIDDLKEKLIINDSTATLFESKFSGLSLEMLKNQLKYGERKTQGRRYDDEIKKMR